MTKSPFSALVALTPRRPFHASYRPSRITRIAWLLARFIRQDLVQFNDYRERFSSSPRTFYRDIAALRDAGIYLESDGSSYRMLCFRPEREAA
jgi:predicted DNA-binding transcriptional regulator YafY